MDGRALASLSSVGLGRRLGLLGAAEAEVEVVESAGESGGPRGRM